MRSKQRRHQRHSKTLSIHPILGETADTFFSEQRSAVRDSLVVQHQYRSRRLGVAQILSEDLGQRIQVKVKPKVMRRFDTVRVAPNWHIRRDKHSMSGVVAAPWRWPIHI